MRAIAWYVHDLCVQRYIVLRLRLSLYVLRLALARRTALLYSRMSMLQQSQTRLEDPPSN